MANKQRTKKRRADAARQQEARRLAVVRRDRRRRLMVGGVVAFLAFALIAPLTAGLILNNRNDSPVEVSSTTLPELPWISPSQAGATIVGATPCPATDGTTERTTGFSSAPPECISPDSTYELTFTTEAGEFTLPVDAGLDTNAANLAVTFARYHTYEGTEVLQFAEDGLLWIGGLGGDTGFTIPSEVVAGDNPYPVGSVVLVSETGSAALDGKIAVVLGEQGSSLLATDPHHALIGMIDDVAPLATITEGTVTAVTATETT